MKYKQYNLGGPGDPLKVTKSSPESISIKQTPLMPFNINPYSVDNMIEVTRMKGQENPITPAEMIAYKTQKAGDYRSIKSKTMSGYKIPITKIRERALGGLTNNESNLIEALVKNLDKPVASFSNQLSMGGKPPKYYLDYNKSTDPNTLKKAQLELQKAGLYKGSIDGKYGPMTEQAISEYNLQSNGESISQSMELYGDNWNRVRKIVSDKQTKNIQKLDNITFDSNKSRPSDDGSHMIVKDERTGKEYGVRRRKSDGSYSWYGKQDPNVTDAMERNFNQYSMGGQVLSSLAGLVPGVGGVLSTAVNIIDQQMDKNNPATMEIPKLKTNTNIYGEMSHGGMITKNFKQYNTGSHASGNDLPINAQGNPSQGNNVVTVQNKENAYTNTKGEAYVFSDVLVNPLTGNKFNQDAAKLNKKYNKADLYKEESNALEFSMNKLSILNEAMKPKEQTKQMYSGGDPKKKYSTLEDQADFPLEEISVPASDNLMFNANLGELYEAQPLPIDTSLIKKQLPQRPLPTLNTVDTSVNSVTNRDAVSETGLEEGLPKKKEDFNYNTVALGLKGLGLAKSIADSLKPAEREKPILPDYRQSDKQMYSTNIDYTQAKQDALAASNLAGNINRSASGSLEQYMGRQAGNYANYADNVGRISMKEALDRNQQYVQRAGYEQNKALDTANRLYQNRIDNQMNRATANLADQKLFSELTQIGSEFNQYQNYKEMVKNNKELTQAYINEGLAILNSKNTNFGFSDDFIEKIKSGKASIDELVTFIATTTSKKTN